MKGTTLQYTAVISVSLLKSATVVANLWSSPILSDLLSENSPIGLTITKNEASLVTSLLLFGSVLGNIFLGPFIDYFGRKGCLLISSVLICISWLLTIFAKSVPVLCTARFFMGTFVAAPVAVSLLYIGEISEGKNRGKLTMICALISESSALLTIILGSLNNAYFILGLYGIILCVLFFFTFYSMPETPYFYVQKKDFEKAKHCLQKLRNNVDVSDEFEKIKLSVERVQTSTDKTNFFHFLIGQNFRKPLLIIIALKTLQQMSGVTAINSYMKMIFNDADTGLDANISSIISISVTLPAFVLASFLIDKFGRKPLYYLATLGTMSALTIEASYFFIQSKEKTITNPIILWFPVSGIYLFHLFRAFGIESLPFLYLGELFPPQVKGCATSVTLVYGSILASLIAFGFPAFSDKFGYGVSFAIFAGFCFAGFIFVRTLLPETKGKLLAEINV